jgi:hypothetical protein
MAMKYKQVGGTPTGVGKEFSDTLQSLLTGSYGAAGATSQANNANPVASTTGIAGVLQDLLAGGAGKIGGAAATQIETQQTNDIAALRSRFGAAGGMAFGTPAAYAESTYRANAAPAIMTAEGQLQEGAIAQLLPYLGQIFNRTTPQAEVVGQQNPWVQGLGLGMQAFSAAAPFFGHVTDGGGGGSPNLTPSNMTDPNVSMFMSNPSSTLPRVGYTPSWSSSPAGMVY